MARTYKRDSKGRFAGGGGSSSGGKRRTAANAQAAYSARGSSRSSTRSPEQRLSRSRSFRERAVNANAGSTPSTRSRTGKRLEQHRRAVDNYMRKLKGSQRKQAESSAGWWARSS